MNRSVTPKLVICMKRTLEKGQDKIQDICDILRRKTLEPAQDEAQKTIEMAKEQAEQIIHEAQRQAEKLITEARKSIEQERNVFQSSLTQAKNQSLESLRQSIEQKLLNKELQEVVVKHTSDPKVIANFITSIVKAIDKEGLAVNLSAVIPSAVNVKDVVQFLAEDVLNKLKDKSVTIGDFAGGAKVRVEGKRMTFDITDAEISELLRSYVRKDFRKLLFGTDL